MYYREHIFLLQQHGFNMQISVNNCFLDHEIASSAPHIGREQNHLMQNA